MSSFKIAVVQPHSHPPPADAKNIDDAVGWIGRAAGEGADFVCFPESYPGPWRMPAPYDPSPRAMPRKMRPSGFSALAPPGPAIPVTDTAA